MGVDVRVHVTTDDSEGNRAPTPCWTAGGLSPRGACLLDFTSARLRPWLTLTPLTLPARGEMTQGITSRRRFRTSPMAAPVAQPTVSIRWRPCPRANRVQLPAVLGRTNELCVCRCSHDGDGWDRVQGLTVITQRRVLLAVTSFGFVTLY